MNTGLHDNDTLISLLKQGDEKAYEYLMNRYYRRLCIYADSLVNDPLAAEDIVQNVFIRLWKKGDFLTVRISLKSFLYKSVYNEYIDQYRKNVALLNVEKRYIEHLNTLVESENTERNEKLLKQVFDIIEQLPPKCREIFMLSKKSGLTHIEISEYLGISVNTVENQIGKAFKILRKNLTKGFYTLFLLIYRLDKN
ncbi:RNA polymerase sigma-70 factor, ECF subfamily [Sinomicrobium oceani]|uniref:RNA polymerase sigma-70 factor, ECF subfamily n=1 Tax=Sinomicrobium oceani TaxID=1150368 RepID=A0A1K1M8F2_9FLAO|nr:RNA polymerase sigma-70 factor [Sinomicrobium oceani]SFW19442.1 RNA polymerase sigma-70 factor, ECF subfamily [Sinomicrobium oceani]